MACTECDEVEDCGCNGLDISCNCITYEGDNLPTTEVIAGDNFCKVTQKIETIIYNIFQQVQECCDNLNLTEVGRGADVPSAIPAEDDPVIYVRDNGVSYTWDGSDWVEIGLITLNEANGVYGTPNATVRSYIDVTPNATLAKTFELKPTYINSLHEALDPDYVEVGVTTSGSFPATIRQRWDGEIEWNGALILESGYLTDGEDNICIDNVELPLATINPDYKPTKYKVFPSLLKIQYSKKNPSYSTKTVTLTGTSGEVSIEIGDYSYSVSFTTSLTDTAAAFVALHATSIKASTGADLTSNGEDLILTYLTSGFPNVVDGVNTSGDLDTGTWGGLVSVAISDTCDNFCAFNSEIHISTLGVVTLHILDKNYGDLSGIDVIKINGTLFLSHIRYYKD